MPEEMMGSKYLNNAANLTAYNQPIGTSPPDLLHYLEVTRGRLRSLIPYP